MNKKARRTQKAEDTNEDQEDDVFLPCNQCHNTGGCTRGNKCEKGFK